MVSPGAVSPNPSSFSTRKVVIDLYGDSSPLCPSRLAVRTRVATRLDEAPLVSHIFWPSIFQPSPSLTALVLTAATSEPSPGSDIENAPRTSPAAILGRYFF